MKKLGIQCKTDKADAGYLDVYEKYFDILKDSEISILEIGIQNGYSLELWNKYFSKAKIYGVDIDDKSQFQNNRTKTLKGDQADKSFLSTLPDNIDIIIDDGGHTMMQQMTTFGYLFKKLAVGGVYIIEDLGTSYMEAYGGNLENKNTALSALETFVETGKISSQYISLEDSIYIETHYKNIVIDRIGGIIAIITKL